MAFTFLNLFGLLEYLVILADFNAHNKSLYMDIGVIISEQLLSSTLKLISRYNIVSRYNSGLKTFLLQVISAPAFYGDLVCKIR